MSNDINILKYLLETTFCLDGEVEWESLRHMLKNPKFPNREKEFKTALADAILNNSISITEASRLTSFDFETQEEVPEFLINEIWKPLYGDEPIELEE